MDSVSIHIDLIDSLSAEQRKLVRFYASAITDDPNATMKVRPSNDIAGRVLVELRYPLGGYTLRGIDVDGHSELLL